MTNFDDGLEKPKKSIFKFGAPGDQIKGTLVAVSDFTGEFGTTKSYSVRAEAGSYHDIVDTVAEKEATQLTPGTVYNFLGKPIFMDDLNQAKIGQKVLVRFVEERKNQKGRAYKFIEALLGGIDDTFIETSAPPLGAVDTSNDDPLV